MFKILGPKGKTIKHVQKDTGAYVELKKETGNNRIIIIGNSTEIMNATIHMTNLGARTMTSNTITGPGIGSQHMTFNISDKQESEEYRNKRLQRQDIEFTKERKIKDEEGG